MGKHSVPITFETRDGQRVVVGEADVETDPISQEMRVVGRIFDEHTDRFPADRIVPGMYSLGFDDVE